MFNINIQLYKHQVDKNQYKKNEENILKRLGIYKTKIYTINLSIFFRQIQFTRNQVQE